MHVRMRQWWSYVGLWTLALCGILCVPRSHALNPKALGTPWKCGLSLLQQRAKKFHGPSTSTHERSPADGSSQGLNNITPNGRKKETSSGGIHSTGATDNAGGVQRESPWSGIKKVEDPIAATDGVALESQPQPPHHPPSPPPSDEEHLPGADERTNAKDATVDPPPSDEENLHVVDKRKKATILSRWYTYMNSIASNMDPDDISGALEHYRVVSITMVCVCVLTVQYLSIHTLLTVSRHLDEFRGFSLSLATETLLILLRGGAYAPMLSMLLLAGQICARENDTDLLQPPHGVKVCMVLLTCGMTLKYLVVLLLPACILHTDGARLSDLVGGEHDVHLYFGHLNFKSRGLKHVFQCLQAVCMLAIFGGVCGIILETWIQSSRTMTLSIKCVFAVAPIMSAPVFLWLARIHLGASSCTADRKSDLLLGAMAMCGIASKAPMVAAVILAVKSRGGALAPAYTESPLAWATCFFYMEIGVVFYEAVTRRQRDSNGTSGDSNVFAVLSYMCLFVASASTNYSIRAQGEVVFSESVSCVEKLAILFFSLRILRVLLASFRDVFSRISRDLPVTLDGCLASSFVGVSVAPSLCALFLACRTRALNVSNQEGSPQGWALDWMEFCVVASWVQVLSCFILPLFVGSAAKVDVRGYVFYETSQYEAAPLGIAAVVAVINYLMLFTTHVGAAAVAVSMFLMTPESTRSDHTGRNHMVGTLVDFASLTLAFLLISLVLASAKVLGLLFKIAIETYGEELLGVSATADWAIFNPLSGRVFVGNLVLHNHFGLLTAEEKRELSTEWQSPYLLKIDNLYVEFGLWRLIRSYLWEIELDVIAITGLTVKYEKMGSVTNLQLQTQSILRAYEHFCGYMWPGEDPYQPSTVPEEYKGKDYYFLHTIQVKDCHVDVILPHDVTLPFKVADFDCPDMYNRPMRKRDLLMFVLNTILKTVQEDERIVKALASRQVRRDLGLSRRAVATVCCPRLATCCSNGEAPN